jgi:hypothetical protein
MLYRVGKDALTRQRGAMLAGPVHVRGVAQRAQQLEFSANNASWWSRSKPNKGEDSMNEPRPTVISAGAGETRSDGANR